MKTKWWHNYPWRNIQTNMRQIDMKDIDAQQYVSELKAFGASLAMINVGGIIASYETELEDQTQSDYLSGDSMGTIIDACHAAGLRVIARMDFSKVREPIFHKHPDWAYRSAEGKIINYNGDVHACINGGYQQEYAYKIMREVLEKFPIDGVFFNMGGFTDTDYSYNYYGFCHCDNCKKKFRERFGLEIPTEKNMKDERYRKYLLFKEQVVAEEKSRMADFVHSINPNVAVDLYDIGRVESNTEYKRTLPYYQYSSSSNTRVLRGISSTLIPSNCSVDFIGFFYRHVAVSAAQQKLRLYQELANLGGLDYYLIGRLDNHQDKTGFPAIKEVFSFHKQHEDIYTKTLRSCATTLLLKSKIWETLAEERGWVRALTENHINFDEALEDEFLSHSLGKYATIIVPGIEKLASASVAKLTEFAASGGDVVVVGNSAYYDEQYAIVDNPFSSLLGIEAMEYRSNDMISSMLKRTEDELKRFPSMKETEVLMLGDQYLYARYGKEVEKLLSLIPPHLYGPPERCYYTQETTLPGLTINPIGKGRGIFIPWQPGTLFYREGYDNTFFFLSDVLLSILGEKPLAKDLTPMVEVTYSKEIGDAFRLVQLVNTSGHFGTSYFKALEVQDVVLTVPCETKLSSVTSLKSGKEVSFTQHQGEVTITLPVLGEFDCLVLR